MLAGYSQGAMVVAEAVKSFRFDQVIYVALFGDPKLYLPEGKGLLPDACLGRNYSLYRVYVPNCRTHTGSLGERDPYVYGELSGKYGLWCNSDDYICGSTALPWNYSGHLKYDERMSQLGAILRGRLPYRASVRSASAQLAVASPRVYALLSADTYYARPGEEVMFDASASYSLDIDISSYEWSIDGGAFVPGAATFTWSFAELGEHSVKVRVTDALDETSEYTSKVIVAEDFAAEALAAPTNVVAWRVDEGILLDWNEAELVAPYLWVRMNGFDLGYVAAAQNTLLITDVEFDEEIVLEVAWLSEDSVSEWREVGWAEEEVEEPPPEPEIPIDSPHTGVELAEGTVLCLLALVCLLIGWRNFRK